MADENLVTNAVTMNKRAWSFRAAGRALVEWGWKHPRLSMSLPILAAGVAFGPVVSGIALGISGIMGITYYLESPLKRIGIGLAMAIQVLAGTGLILGVMVYNTIKQDTVRSDAIDIAASEIMGGARSAGINLQYQRIRYFRWGTDTENVFVQLDLESRVRNGFMAKIDNGKAEPFYSVPAGYEKARLLPQRKPQALSK